MARIGPVKLNVKIKGDTATAEVTYDILFSKTDIKKQTAYEEECRLIGDDTHAGDPAEAGGDETLEFMSPLFNKDVQGTEEKMARTHKKSFRAMDLNEDMNAIPNPDEIRALVMLRPVGNQTGKMTRRESPMVKLKLG